MKENRASETAQLIALATVMLAADPQRQHLVAPGAAEWSRLLLESHPRGQRAVRWARTRWLRALWGFAERLAWPGISEHYWHRKNWIEARVRSALAAGWQRVLIPGAGLDTLALRLAPEFGGVEFVELDHPATRRFKLRALAAAQPGIPGNLRFVEADLAHAALPGEFAADGRSTIVVAEGLLMYLPPAAVREFLQSVAGLERGRLLFTFMRGDVRQRRIVQLKLKQRGEPFLWKARPNELGGVLAECGLSLVEHATGSALAEAAGGTAFEGEDVVYCERRLD